MTGNSDEETRKKYCFATQLYSSVQKRRRKSERVEIETEEKEKKQTTAIVKTHDRLFFLVLSSVVEPLCNQGRVK